MTAACCCDGNWNLPSVVGMDGLVDRARTLARELLQERLPQRWRHVAQVGGEADRIAQAYGADGRSLAAAAWLHDIGYAPDLAVAGFHPLDGARFLRAQGWPERVCALVAHHSCAIREAQLRGLAQELTTEFDDEASSVRDALWYCDLTTGPSGDRVHVAQRLSEIVVRYGPEHVVTRFVDSARGELVGAVKRTEARLRAAGLDQPM